MNLASLNKNNWKLKAKLNLLRREINFNKTIKQNPKEVAQVFSKHFVSVRLNPQYWKIISRLFNIMKKGFCGIKSLKRNKVVSLMT